MEDFQLVENMEDKVKQIIAETLHVPLDVVTLDLSIGDIKEWDSMGNIAIIAALEEKLNIEFPIDELFELTSVKALVEKIKLMTND